MVLISGKHSDGVERVCLMSSSGLDLIMTTLEGAIETDSSLFLSFPFFFSPGILRTDQSIFSAHLQRALDGWMDEWMNGSVKWIFPDLVHHGTLSVVFMGHHCVLIGVLTIRGLDLMSMLKVTSGRIDGGNGCMNVCYVPGSLRRWVSGVLCMSIDTPPSSNVNIARPKVSAEVQLYSH